jgi:hypothetical protein
MERCNIKQLHKLEGKAVKRSIVLGQLWKIWILRWMSLVPEHVTISAKLLSIE